MATSRCTTEVTSTAGGSDAAGEWWPLHPVSTAPSAAKAINAEILVCTVLLQLDRKV